MFDNWLKGRAENKDLFPYDFRSTATTSDNTGKKSKSKNISLHLFTVCILKFLTLEFGLILPASFDYQYL